jgi:hypothetical protein
MMERTCTQCHIPQPLDREHFYYRRRDRLGFQRQCIRCTRTALDQADAKRKAERQRAREAPPLRAVPAPPARSEDGFDWGWLVWGIQAHAWDIAEVLVAAAWSGTPDVLERIAAHVFGEREYDEATDEYRPQGQPADGFWELADIHTNMLQERVPHVLDAIEACEAEYRKWLDGEPDADSGCADSEGI